MAEQQPFSEQALDAGVAAWFGVTKVEAERNFIRDRMQAAITAALEHLGAEADEAFEELYQCDRRDPANAGDLAIWRAAWVAGQRAALAQQADWVAERWHAEVAQRPLVNVHRRSLDDVWRQVLGHLGVADHQARLGPTHDELLGTPKGQ